MRFFLPLFAALALSACASSGPLYPQASKGYKPVAKDASRLILYREGSSMGAMIQPSVMLDGAKVRDSVPGSYTMLDVKPGAHVVSAETEVEKKVELTLAPAQTAYVRENIAFGWVVGRVTVEQVMEATALRELTELHEIATPTMAEVKE